MPTLNWIGKEKVINHHRDVPFRVLEHKFSYTETDGEVLKPILSSNKIINGDNLEALKSLLPQYEGKIKCIYIDPPYNTGNENWIYNDNVNHPKIRKWLETTLKAKENNREASVGIDDLARHDKWLCMMYPRIKLLHKLLSNDGCIFISCDDNEQANLKLICDEIFGGSNFVTNIHWKRSESQNNNSKLFSVVGEFIICYMKNKEGKEFNKTELQDTALKEYRYEDEKGKFRRGTIVDNSRGKHILEIESPNGIRKTIKSIRTKEFFKEKELDGMIYWTATGTPYLKLYLEESEGQISSNWFDKAGVNEDASEELTKMGINFPFSKPYSLIKKLIKISTDKNDIVLDSFAGSGTTAHAVLSLNMEEESNRKFVLVEMENYAETITAERVKKVICGYGDNAGTGGDFEFYMLGKSLFIGDNFEFLNEEVGIGKIREYVWYSETRTAFENLNKKIETSFLGKKDGTAYYFIYKKNELTTLDYDSLAEISEKALNYVIYADNCLLSNEFMLKNNIIFKKIPRDITKF